MKRTIHALLSVVFLGSAISANASEWEFDMPHTQVKFRVKHLMIANVWGQFDTFSGSVNYDPEHPENASVSVTIDVNSINTGNSNRDNHLRSEAFFYVEKYPLMTFVSKKVIRVGDSLEMIGDLTIRGVTKEITLNVEGPTPPMKVFGGTKIAASANARINRLDFGINWNKSIEGGGVVADNMVDILIEAELNKK
ncbi:MAG: YceI family protein [bacterium]